MPRRSIMQKFNLTTLQPCTVPQFQCCCQCCEDKLSATPQQETGACIHTSPAALIPHKANMSEQEKDAEVPTAELQTILPPSKPKQLHGSTSHSFLSLRWVFVEVKRLVFICSKSQISCVSTTTSFFKIATNLRLAFFFVLNTLREKCLFELVVEWKSLFKR